MKTEDQKITSGKFYDPNNQYYIYIITNIWFIFNSIHSPNLYGNEWISLYLNYSFNHIFT